MNDPDNFEKIKTDTENPPLLRGAGEIGRATGLPPRQAQRLLSRGELPGFRLGGEWVVTRETLKVFMAAREAESLRRAMGKER